MPGSLPLFDDPPSFDRARLRARLGALAQRGVFIGASSWKYEGWLGQIYTAENYSSRGRFSRKRFEAECLNEYAATFPIVCGDFSFYQFPSDAYWSKLFGSAPRTLQYAFKAPEEITVKAFPAHPRYGPRAGMPNGTFLNADLLGAAFLEPLAAYRDQIAVVLFEFGTFSKQCYPTVSEFLDELSPFLEQLPLRLRFAIEVRNQEFLTPEYFACLRERGIAHVFNSWTRMPGLDEQLQLPEARTASFSVTRALLRPGRSYEEAVERFTPYDSVKDPNDRARAALRQLIADAQQRNEPSYIFVNNRLEGNAPGTIEAVID